MTSLQLLIVILFVYNNTLYTLYNSTLLVNRTMFDKQGLISYINGISLEILET